MSVLWLAPCSEAAGSANSNANVGVCADSSSCCRDVGRAHTRSVSTAAHARLGLSNALSGYSRPTSAARSPNATASRRGWSSAVTGPRKTPTIPRCSCRVVPASTGTSAIRPAGNASAGSSGRSAVPKPKGWKMFITPRLGRQVDQREAAEQDRAPARETPR
ncbi:hypothetical protein [Saccharothrix texasensis]|uniref:Uncharacterized protein n=1 Tax=Saccharothrix texasensis TaxID=103734 RepID=A0A3N1H8A7_9PSEU|nr:hypothetical protein [Saccharothrix texasensis]ROP38671.1 hypothetical protein EDD40_4033 [Saccharothrix texasensis]